MLFNSLEFVLFLPAVLAIYALLPARGRGLLLLLASYFFYGWWKVEYLGLILVSTGLDYAVGLALGRTESEPRRRLLVGLSLAGNLGLLGAFKYLGMFTSTLADLGLLQRAVSLVLPVGISFYTFQSLAYTIDVYRRNLAPERSFVDFALYVSFFPQLVAGPIERATHLLPQLKRFEIPDYDRLVRGGRLILWGFYKKLAIADPLALYADRFLMEPAASSGAQIVLGLYFFAFQIYCDFSGYTDIARGTARLFGVDIMENFRRPYASGSVREFWQRWHISLSTWFRDYVYIPLGGGRAGSLRRGINILVVFGTSGLWHGADWHYVIWGLMHGALMLIERAIRRPVVWLRRRLMGERFPRTRAALRTLTLFHVILGTWILFRAPSLSDSMTMIERIPVGLFTNPIADLSTTNLAFPVVFVAIMEGVEWLHSRFGMHALLGRLPRPARWALYLGLLYTILLFGSFDEKEFIYFRF
jgi:D-alanyl-lipoteichoic acid acyltransferase DltB (MBOAT superfamily)